MMTAHFMVLEPGKPAAVAIYHTTNQKAVDRLGRHLNETATAGQSFSLAHVVESVDEQADGLPVSA